MLIETERLILRQFRLDDDKFVLEVLNEKDFINNIGNRHVTNLNQAKTYIRDRFHSPQKINGFTMYLVQLKSSGSPIGMCGLVKRNELEIPDLGFAFLDIYKRKGYAFEAAFAVLGFAENILKIRKLAAITQSSNERSIRLLQKIGFNFVENMEIKSDEEALILFEKQLY